MKNEVNEWQSVNKPPLDQIDVDVMDEFGIIRTGSPCYYPFKVINTGGGKWSSTIEHCEPYHDGSWLIESHLFSDDFGTVMMWRYKEATVTPLPPNQLNSPHQQ